MSILIRNARIVDGLGTAPYAGWLLTDGRIIAAMGHGEPDTASLPAADETVDARGALLMPGVIDCHVHFREPGLTHKATIASETRAALAGGVTSFIDMPNTKPPTVTREAWDDKMRRAADTSAINYAFMLGATADNLDELRRADPALMPAVKVFMGSSTGGMLLRDDSVLRRVFAEQPHRVVVHAEDQGVIDRLTERYRPEMDPADIAWHSRLRPADCCVAATERALELAARYGTRLHVAHVTTAPETALFDPGNDVAGRQYTAEVSPHHLVFCDEDYPRLGSRIKMNPAVKTAADRDALRRGLAEGRLSIVATDHAPHTLAEKAGDVFTAMSGAPMLQFSLVLMLGLYDPVTVARRMSAAPAALYGIRGRGSLAPGMRADLVMLRELGEPHTITDADVLSPCGWTPAVGLRTRWAVERTIVNGGLPPEPLVFA